jgi:hypothetical protein
MGVFLLLFLQKKKCLLAARFWIAAPLRGSQ